NVLRHAGRALVFDLAETFELLGVDDGGVGVQRHGAAGVTGAAAARDDGEAELDARVDDMHALVFRVRREHYERQLNAPVARVGDVRHARRAIEADVVLARDLAEALDGALAQRLLRRQPGLELA